MPVYFISTSTLLPNCQHCYFSFCNKVDSNRVQVTNTFLIHPLSTLQPLLPYIPYIHYNDVIMGAIASQITSLTNGYYSTVYSGADQRKHQSPASLAFVRGIHRWPVNSPHKWPVTRKMFPFDDVIMYWESFHDLFHWVGSILFGYPICFTKSW